METIALSNIVGRVTFMDGAMGKEAYSLIALWTSFEDNILTGETLNGVMMYRPFNREMYDKDSLKCIAREHTWKRCLYQLLPAGK